MKPIWNVIFVIVFFFTVLTITNQAIEYKLKVMELYNDFHTKQIDFLEKVKQYTLNEWSALVDISVKFMIEMELKDDFVDLLSSMTLDELNIIYYQTASIIDPYMYFYDTIIDLEKFKNHIKLAYAFELSDLDLPDEKHKNITHIQLILKGENNYVPGVERLYKPVNVDYMFRTYLNPYENLKECSDYLHGKLPENILNHIQDAFVALQESKIEIERYFPIDSIEKVISISQIAKSHSKKYASLSNLLNKNHILYSSFGCAHFESQNDISKLHTERPEEDRHEEEEREKEKREKEKRDKIPSSAFKIELSLSIMIVCFSYFVSALF